jgi:hypothetical protein
MCLLPPPSNGGNGSDRGRPQEVASAGSSGGGGFNDVAAAPAAFLPPHPTAQIEARVGRAIIFLFSYGMDTFRRPAHADKSCEGFIGANGKCVIFVGKFLSAWPTKVFVFLVV